MAAASASCVQGTVAADAAVGATIKAARPTPEPNASFTSVVSFIITPSAAPIGCYPTAAPRPLLTLSPAPEPDKASARPGISVEARPVCIRFAGCQPCPPHDEPTPGSPRCQCRAASVITARRPACTCVGLTLVKTLAAQIWVFGEGWRSSDPPGVLALSASGAWGVPAVAGGPPSLRGGCGPV